MDATSSDSAAMTVELFALDSKTGRRLLTFGRGELESENAKLKKMYAELSLTHRALQDAAKKSCSTSRSERLVRFMVAEHNVSVREACRAVRLARSAFYAPRRLRNDGPIIAAIRRFVEVNPTQGFDKLYPAVRAEGFGKCRLYRVYRARPEHEAPW